MLFTKHGGTIISVEDLQGKYAVNKAGVVTGSGELTEFDRTGNTYGLETWVYVGAAEGFPRPAPVP